MKKIFLIIFVFTFKAYGQTGKELFSNKDLRDPLSVKNLDFSEKKLQTLPVELIKFKNLEKIDLSDNPNLDLSESLKFLSTFKKLKKLTLKGDYTSIPYNISELKNIEELILESNNLTSIPEGVKKLTRLRNLQLFRNKINNISLQLGDLPNLEKIELGLNELTVFPDDLSFIPNLKIISVYHNSISLVPPGIKRLPSVENLDIRDNKLSSLPSEFGELKTIKVLNLMGNQLSSMEPIFELSSLEILKLGDNKISEIPDKISMLKNLKDFSYTGNPIKILSKQIVNLQSITNIDIDGSDSTKLPEYINLMATLLKLESLSIRLPGIKKMPVEFERLTQVKRFSVWDCDLIKPEKTRLRKLFPKADFNFYKSWGDESFYKNKPCSMDENNWDTISLYNLNLKYLLIGQSYDHTDNDGNHYWDGEILLTLDKKAVDKETAEKIIIAIADRLEMQDITAVRTCRTSEMLHSAVGPQGDESKQYYKENFIATYNRQAGLVRY